jgi:hypothetical protein
MKETRIQISIFLLSSYEIWENIGFTSGKSNFLFAFFHFLGLIIPKKHVKSEKKIPSVTRRCRRRRRRCRRRRRR